MTRGLGSSKRRREERMLIQLCRNGREIVIDMRGHLMRACFVSRMHAHALLSSLNKLVCNRACKDPKTVEEDSDMYEIASK